MLFQSIACQRGIVFATVVERAITIEQTRVKPARFCVAYDDETFDLDSPVNLAEMPVDRAISVAESCRFAVLRRAILTRYLFG